MRWQTIAVAVVVAGAIFYLVWKWFIASRTPRAKKGPDVPLSKLVRTRPRDRSRLESRSSHEDAK